MEQVQIGTRGTALRTISPFAMEEVMRKLEEKCLDPAEYINLYRRGELPGKIKRKRVERLTLEDIFVSCRPFFRKLCEDDPVYVACFRTLRYAGAGGFGVRDMHSAYTFHSGRNLASTLCEKGIIKSLDDLPWLHVANRAYLMDIVRESNNTMVIDIYECISCSGLPIVGTALCDFERGMLSAALEYFIGRNVINEVECWGLGHTRCRFIVYFE